MVEQSHVWWLLPTDLPVNRRALPCATPAHGQRILDAASARTNLPACVLFHLCSEVFDRARRFGGFDSELHSCACRVLRDLTIGRELSTISGAQYWPTMDVTFVDPKACSRRCFPVGLDVSWRRVPPRCWRARSGSHAGADAQLGERLPSARPDGMIRRGQGCVPTDT